MRDPNIGLACPPVEVDAVLLEQMTLLATASTAPASMPWWQRVATKSGAVAVAGVLALSGAAYADRGELAPIVTSMAGHSKHHVPRHHATHSVAPVAPPAPAVTDLDQTAGVSKTVHSRHTHGLHGKRGKGTRRAGGGNDHRKGQVHSLLSSVQGLAGTIESHGKGSGGNGKPLIQTKTGQRGASHGNGGWPYWKRQLQPQR